jgi:1-acyl-sn-glycerol-3-phosphate acyltransferase
MGEGVLFFPGCGSRRLRGAIDRAQRYVFMANHQSLFDIPVLLATLPVRPGSWPREPLQIRSSAGRCASAGSFRWTGGTVRRRDMFSEAIARLRAGVSLLLFPEETRSLDGKLHPFHAAASFWH